MIQPFEISVDSDGRHFVVHGDLDLATAPELGARIGAALDGRGDLVIDLGRCGFVDTAAVNVLHHAADRLAENGARLKLIAPSPQTRQLLRMVGLSAYVGGDDDTVREWPTTAS
jgi:anti-anti-sigma factor